MCSQLNNSVCPEGGLQSGHGIAQYRYTWPTAHQKPKEEQASGLGPWSCRVAILDIPTRTMQNVKRMLTNPGPSLQFWALEHSLGLAGCPFPFTHHSAPLGLAAALADSPVAARPLAGPESHCLQLCITGDHRYWAVNPRLAAALWITAE